MNVKGALRGGVERCPECRAAPSSFRETTARSTWECGVCSCRWTMVEVAAKLDSEEARDIKNGVPFGEIVHDRIDLMFRQFVRSAPNHLE